MANEGIVGFPLFHAQRFESVATLFILAAISEEFQQAAFEIPVGSHGGFSKLNANVTKIAHGERMLPVFVSQG